MPINYANGSGRAGRPLSVKAALMPFVAVQPCAVVNTPSEVAPASGRSAVLSARLPNGTTLELPGNAEDAALIRAIVDALWSQR